MANDPLVQNTGIKPVDLEVHVDSQEKDGHLWLTYTLHSPSGIVPYHHLQIPTSVQAGKIEEFQRLFVRLEKLGKGFDTGDERILNEEIIKLEGFGRYLYQKLFPAEIHEAYRDFRRVVHPPYSWSPQPWPREAPFSLEAG
jgi:hypothetical protein